MNRNAARSRRHLIGFRRDRREAVFQYLGRARLSPAAPLTLLGQVKRRIGSAWRKRAAKVLLDLYVASAVSAVQKPHMSTKVRIAIIVYLVQAAVGIAIGFTLPWLRIFGGI